MLDSFSDALRVVVAGAGGGIGAAAVRHLESIPKVQTIYALSRTPGATSDKVQPIHMDYDDPASIEAAGAQISKDGPLDLVFVATGILHDATGLRPEKDWRQLDPAHMSRVFHINATGPALLARALLPLLSGRERSVFAALSARVGSISDNRLGGWYSYRASKAALNMIIRTLAIELERKRRTTLCVGLHPGTVATELSSPFVSGVKPGQVVSPDVASANLLCVIDRLTPDDNGHLIAWDGAPISY